MRMSLACDVGHEPMRPLVGHSVRVALEHGRCPVCTDRWLDGIPSGGLGWARCSCCESEWRLEDEGFAVRTGRLVEEWS
jgi:formate dehydrogenase maturation protein FdhE